MVQYLDVRATTADNTDRVQHMVMYSYNGLTINQMANAIITSRGSGIYSR